MPESVREQILARIATVLGGITGFSGLVVTRNPQEAQVSYPCLCIHDSDETIDEGNFQGVANRVMQPRVEGFVQQSGNSLTNIGTEINRLYAAVETALLADRTLNGLAVDTRITGCVVVNDEGEGRQPTAAFEATFEVQYWTRSGDPFTAHA